MNNEKIKQGMGEVKNVGLVKMSYPYEKQDEQVIITEESEETLKYKDEIVLSFTMKQIMRNSVRMELLLP